MATIVAAAGGGNWATNSTWVGGAHPTAADDVQLTSTSGNVTFTVNDACRSLDCTGYTGTLAGGGQALKIGDATPGTGNKALVLVAGMTLSNAGFNFVSTSATAQTITSNGKVPQQAHTFSGIGGSWKFADALTSAQISFTAGTIDFNGFNATVANSVSISGTNTKVLTLGSSNLNITTASGVWFSNTTSNGSFSMTGSGSIQCTGASPNNLTFNGGSNTYTGTVSFGSAGMQLATVQVGSTFNNLTFLGHPSALSTFTVGSITVNGTLSVTGADRALRMVDIVSPVVGTPSTLTLNATPSLAYVNLRDITGAGTFNWNISAITGLSGDLLGNSGITFTTPTTQTATGTASFTWSTHGWTTHVPLPQDTVSIPNAFVAGRTVTMDSIYIGTNVTFSCTGNPAASLATAGRILGNLELAAGMTASSTTTFGFYGRSLQTVKSNGATNNWSYQIQPLSSVKILDDCPSGAGNTFSLAGGTFDINGKNFQHAAFSSSNSVTRTLKFNGGDFKLTGTSAGTHWNTSTNTGLTVDLTGGGTISHVTTANAWSINAGSAAVKLPTITYTNAGSTGSLTFLTATAATALIVADATNARSTLFTAATASTFDTINVRGTAGKLMTIDSVTAATHTLHSSNVVIGDYLSIKNSIADASPKFYAGSHSTDVSGNTNWIFTDPPAGGNLPLLGVG